MDDYPVVDLQEYLDILPFPAFVVDCNTFIPHVDVDTPSTDDIRPIMVNKATRDGSLSAMVAKEIKENPAFRRWLCLTHPDGTSVRGQEFFETKELEFSYNFLRSMTLDYNG